MLDGADGLHGVHEHYPELSPMATWKGILADQAHSPSLYTPSSRTASSEILRILRENPRDTIRIAAIGPMTNLALAAAEDPETFLRVKEVVAMGGAVEVPGNITPLAEFNVHADAVAAAIVFAVTSPNPRTTMPPLSKGDLAAIPAKLPQELNLTLVPLDVTSPHRLGKQFFAEQTEALVQHRSPLAMWMSYFMARTFDKIDSLKPPGSTSEPGLQLHDPMTIWYLLSSTDERWRYVSEDLRIESSG